MKGRTISISEAARLLEKSRSTIREWFSAAGIPTTKSDLSEEEFERLKTVKELRDQGKSLDEIRAICSSSNSDSYSSDDLMDDLFQRFILSPWVEAVIPHIPQHFEAELRNRFSEVEQAFREHRARRYATPPQEYMEAENLPQALPPSTNTDEPT